MFRLLCINPCYRNICNNVLYKCFTCNKKQLGLKVSIHSVPHSTLPKHKMILKFPKQKNKVKLKIKPYEELFKVLEVREQELKNGNMKPVINVEVKFPTIEYFPRMCDSFTENKISNLHKVASKVVDFNEKVKFHPEHSSQCKSITETKSSGVYNAELYIEEKIKAPVIESSSTEPKSIIDTKKFVNSTNEGIYTVKKVPKSSKKKSQDCDKESSKDKSKKKTDNKGKIKSTQLEDKEKLKTVMKHNYAMRTLKSYIEVSIHANEVEKAQKAFEYYREKNKLKKTDIGDVDLYNLLIFGWAQKGRLDKVKYLFSLMHSDNIFPTLQSYAGYIECISRSKFLDFSEVRYIINEMKTKGLSLQDLLQKCIFVGDQKDKILEVLGYVEKNLNLPSYAPGKAYSSKLLEKLNDKLYEKGNSHQNFSFQAEDIPKLSAAQMEVESRYSLKIKSVDTVADVNEAILNSRNYLKECEDIWKKKLTLALKNIKSLEKKSHGVRPSIYPYLAVIDIEILVNLLLQEVRMLSETSEFFSPNAKVLYRELGVKVMNHYFIWLNRKNKITDKVLFIHQNYLSYLLDPELCAKYSPREYWEFLKHKHFDGPTIDISNISWPHSVLTYIGKYLYDILQRNISFNTNCVHNRAPSKHMTQAFYFVYKAIDVKLSKQMRAHPLLCKLYRDARLEYLEFDVSLVPMLCPPHPWVKHNSGGLLITGTPFIRFPEHAQHQAAYYSKVPSQQLNPYFDSLNSLSLCPWTINKPILDIVIDVFQKGGNEELDIPLNPSSFGSGPKIHSLMTKQEKAAAYKQKNELEKKKDEMTSLWFDCLYKLSIANHFREKVFWFPHNLDFRGRVYPTPPHFNHLGSDMARSILLFADGQPLGKNGLEWLKIHLINLTGFKKRDPHAERLRYANEMLPEVLDSADRPFDGNQWWKTSDKPWQTLACCKELALAVRHSNPEEYVSHFPIHQDGSCNGLQHYAALGRDELGAIEVNLHPSDSPQDVYSGVAALVEKERLKDAIDGLEIAHSLEGFVKRKVVKQTIMTFVYGVTRYGAKLQILKQLKDIPDLSEKCHHEGATYLTKMTFHCIKEMFTATKQIQDWFTECAELITKVSGDTLEWVTPIGLPVIQPYHKSTSVRSSKYCISQGKDLQLYYTSNYEPYQLPNIRKQKNAFAPNFIHSLDSTHMMLTSLLCQRKGITFVSVHDCYWTHASTVQIMNKICREQFVSLHSEPILEDLSSFFLEKYARVANKDISISKKKKNLARLKLKDIVSKVPKKGKFNLNKVLESEYFFS